jgi:hypothetical protein
MYRNNIYIHGYISAYTILTNVIRKHALVRYIDFDLAINYGKLYGCIALLGLFTAHMLDAAENVLTRNTCEK